ncbi:chitinase [Streptomyces sp. NBC_00503]|uniref:chitinase n=1 Tax=Streptomyces sp. NBC_00503 TaxID=2903659 RepID=UPI002E7FD32A|nr:glycosyl hydrolase family 18 protein [Streptomyces sp. NBC_00503]WUD83316.1 glycosyl hydrolase family 18 protein [Streptomyces sp. NBC_00503]
MNRIRSLALLGAATLTAGGLTALAAGTAQAADVNVVRNGGFESGLSNWTCTSGSGAVVSSPVFAGSAALKATPAGQDNAQCSQTVTVKPNSTYTLSEQVNGSYVYLGATGTGTQDVSTWTPGTGGGFQKLSTTFTTGASTTQVTVWTHGWYGQPGYVVDEFSVFGPDGGGGTDPAPTVPGAPAGTAVSGQSSSGLTLSWNAVTGATGYYVYQDGVRVQTVTSGTSAQITGLAASTSYSFQVSAYNAAGEGTKAAAVTGTTTSGGGGNPNPNPAVPKHALTGYWQNFNNGATVQKISDVSSQYDIIAVSFADATSTPGSIAFNLDSAGLGGYTVAQFKADIAAKKTAGKSVVLSIGGEKGTITVNDTASANNLANSAYALMQEYGFSGIDIDLENGLNPTYMTQALHSLASKAGSSFVLTMAPQTIDMQSTQGGYFKTALAVKDILTVVNMQYYNSGSMNGCDGNVYSQGTVDFLTALACIQLEGGLDPSQVGIGVPASPSGAGSGYVSPTIVNNALDCLTKGTSCGNFKPSKTYPALRGAMTWSTNWDAKAGSAWSNAVGPKVHGLP